uniref:ribosomal protein L5 n=1 Tax=Paralagenidium karlingii TaxID=1440115 RepID=UPI0026E1AD7E|nr:ribosomal protein L5 [Paralagenidium karlingii]WJH17919.1 ribosomal protein L5 [Paralagenidium karlingii]
MDQSLLNLENKKILKYYHYLLIFYKMNFNYYYNQIILYDLTTKFNFQNAYKLPKITKISLNIGLKDSNLNKKKLIYALTVLKLISNQKPILTKSKKNQLLLKIKKGSIVGCKVTLRKKNIYLFLEKFFFFISPNLKNKEFKFNSNIVNFKIRNLLDFNELKQEFMKFKDIPYIDVSIYLNDKNKINESILKTLLNLFYITAITNKKRK